MGDRQADTRCGKERVFSDLPVDLHSYLTYYGHELWAVIERTG